MAVARKGSSDTLASHVYDELCAAILVGEYSPGERLMPAELRGRFGVSISVVREASSRLAEQRIVRGSSLAAGEELADLPGN